ncbi:hypothetical protein D3C76_1336500 [compost metagenome]
MLHHGEGLVGQPEGQRHAPAGWQVTDEGLQGGAVEGVAQVDDEGGEQHHRRPGAAAEQGDGDELGRTGEHQQRHAHGLPGGQPGAAGQGAEDDAEGNGADDHRDDIAGAVDEFC